MNADWVHGTRIDADLGFASPDPSRLRAGGLRARFGEAGESRPTRRTRPRSSREPLFLNYQGGRLSTRSVDWLVRKVHGRVQHTVRDQSARAPPLVRDALAGARRRSSRDPGITRARAPKHHAALHAPQRHAIARDVSESPPESLGAVVRSRCLVELVTRSPQRTHGRRITDHELRTTDYEVEFYNLAV